MENEEKERCVGLVLSYLMEEFDPTTIFTAPPTYGEQRVLVRSLLTVRNQSESLPPNVLEAIDALLMLERSERSLVSAANLPRLSQHPQTNAFSKISVWKGDITTLQCAAIVNAANNQMLGCFHPSHLCIDNVIHAAAGPRLRASCQTLMQRRNWRPEANGKCIVTPAYSLPCKYVLHTVGPMLVESQSVATVAQQVDLMGCYRSCLNAAHNQGDIDSVAFCCISTGLFRYPADEAAILAAGIVLEWLAQHESSGVQHVIFNVFSEEDESCYYAVLDMFAASSSCEQQLEEDEVKHTPQKRCH
jgi:O-acetyl-ADP-ribose deacetylase (regulator of RNase III)